MSSDEQTIAFSPLSSVVSQQQLIEATSIVAYQSRGQLLVVGEVTSALAVAETLSDLKITVVSLDTAENASGPSKNLTEDGIALYRADSLRLTGYLGSFQAVAVGATEEIDLGVGVYLEDGLFDLVLDLYNQPQLSHELLPFGYLHAPSEESLQAALQQIPELVGDFEKPKFFNYRKDVCAHSRSELNGCNRCVDVCATGAIVSAGEGVSVDPYLCQGCGSCATVCPSGAMSYAYPRVSDAIERTRTLLNESSSCTALVLHLETQQNLIDQASLPASCLPLAVEEVTAFGMDYWAAIVASGVHRVYLLLEGHERSDRHALNEQMALFHDLLSGLGVSERVVSIIDNQALLNLDESSAQSDVFASLAPAVFTTHDDKRQTIRMALDHLHEQLGAKQPVQPLPHRAPFGVINVDDSSCTLCMACVSVCPGKALLDGQDSPALRMIEANCLQCGLCESACPESAISLQAQYRYDSNEARKISSLHSEEPFHCVTCHKAFASHKMISNMLGKLTGHWMFQDDKALRRLKMCDDCRVKDIFEDNDEGIDVHKEKDTSAT